MDRDQARFILSAGQHSGADDDRPEMIEALEFAKRDPELAAWLARERRCDAAISQKLHALEPPGDLRSRVVAGGRASRSAQGWHRRRRHLWFGFAMAASVMLVVGIALWQSGKRSVLRDDGERSLLAWEQACVDLFSNPFFSLDVVDDSYPKLESHLAGCRAPVTGELPFTDAIKAPIGCKVLDWNGSSVSLACFTADSGEVVHLFVMRRGGVDEATLAGGAHRTQHGDYATVSWLQGDLLVMVASRLPADKLDRMLTTRTASVITASLGAGTSSAS